jgi:sulfur-oxidizing protein SoxY
MKAIGAANPMPSKDIVLKVADIAENGASVPVEVASRIAGTETISIIADKNPSPLVASFEFASGAEPYLATRIKLMESTNVRVIVKAGGRHYQSVREVKVTLGGCA